jgi:hypothetical protein
MKAVFAVVVSFLVFLIGWTVMVGLLFLIFAVAGAARPGLGPDNWLTLLIMWILGPGVGAFFAIYVPGLLFQSVDLKTIFVSFASIITFLLVVLFLFEARIISVHGLGIGRAVLVAVQGAVILVGAYIGRLVGEEVRD